MDIIISFSTSIENAGERKKDESIRIIRINLPEDKDDTFRSAHVER